MVSISYGVVSVCCSICENQVRGGEQLEWNKSGRESGKCLVTNKGKHPKLSTSSGFNFSPIFGSCLSMHSLLFLLSLVPTLVFPAGLPQIRGVHPSLLSQYKPKGSTWTCLDGSKTIPWSAVNDDFCDCIDGSDEPGISFPPCFLSESYKPY